MPFHEYVRADRSREDDDDMHEPEPQWHLDKRVPLAIIITIFLQTAGFIYVVSTWKADVDARLSQLEKSDTDRKPQESRLIRLEERLESIKSSLVRIESKLESPNGANQQRQ